MSFGIALPMNSTLDFKIKYLSYELRYIYLENVWNYMVKSMSFNIIAPIYSPTLLNTIIDISLVETYGFLTRIIADNSIGDNDYYGGKIRIETAMFESTLNHDLIDYYPEVKLYNTETNLYVDESTYDVEYVTQTQLKIKFYFIGEYRKLKAILVGRKDELILPNYYVASNNYIFSVVVGQGQYGSIITTNEINGFSAGDKIYFGGVIGNFTQETEVLETIDDNTFSTTTYITGETSKGRVGKRTAFYNADYGTEYDINIIDDKYTLSGDHSSEFVKDGIIRVTDSNGKYWYDIIGNVDIKGGYTFISTYLGFVENAATICIMTNIS